MEVDLCDNTIEASQPPPTGKVTRRKRRKLVIPSVNRGSTSPPIIVTDNVEDDAGSLDQLLEQCNAQIEVNIKNNGDVVLSNDPNELVQETLDPLSRKRSSDRLIGVEEEPPKKRTR